MDASAAARKCPCRRRSPSRHCRCRIQRRGLIAATRVIRAGRTGRSNGSSSRQVCRAPGGRSVDKLRRVQSANAVASSTTHVLPRTETMSPAESCTRADRQRAYRAETRQNPGDLRLCASEDCNSCPQPRFRIVKKCQHEGVLGESPMDDGALDAAAAAVNQPHVAKAGCTSLSEIFIDERWDVLGSERVEVE